jgi:hypothetical protein
VEFSLYVFGALRLFPTFFPLEAGFTELSTDGLFGRFTLPLGFFPGLFESLLQFFPGTFQLKLRFTG